MTVNDESVGIWQLDLPWLIDGYEVIVVADVLAPDLCAGPIPLTPVVGAPATWAPEHSVRTAREQHPGILVIGLWQLLGMLTCRRDGNAIDTWVVWTNKEAGSGYYLARRAEGHWVSGQIAGHQPVGFAGVDLQQGQVVDPSEVRWSDDLQPALLPEEKAMARRAVPRRALRNHAVAALALLLGISAAWGWDRWQTTGLLTQVTQVDAEHERLALQRAALAASREQALPAGFDSTLHAHLFTLRLLERVSGGVSAALEVPLLRLDHTGGRALLQRSAHLLEWRSALDEWQSRYGWHVASETDGRTLVTWAGLPEFAR